MKKMSVAAGALLAVGILAAGCTANPGSAAVVNGNIKVSETSVDNLSQEISAAGGSRSNALNVALTVAVAKPIMDNFKDQLTDEFLSSSLANCSQQLGFEVSAKSSSTLQDYCHMITLANTDNNFLTQVNDALTSASVDLNPRYGSVDSQNGLPNYLTESDRSLPSSNSTSK